MTKLYGGATKTQLYGGVNKTQLFGGVSKFGDQPPGSPSGAGCSVPGAPALQAMTPKSDDSQPKDKPPPPPPVELKAMTPKFDTPKPLIGGVKKYQFNLEIHDNVSTPRRRRKVLTTGIHVDRTIPQPRDQDNKEEKKKEEETETKIGWGSENPEEEEEGKRKPRETKFGIAISKGIKRGGIVDRDDFKLFAGKMEVGVAANKEKGGYSGDIANIKASGEVAEWKFKGKRLSGTLDVGHTELSAKIGTTNTPEEQWTGVDLHADGNIVKGTVETAPAQFPTFWRGQFLKIQAYAEGGYGASAGFKFGFGHSKEHGVEVGGGYHAGLGFTGGTGWKISFGPKEEEEGEKAKGKAKGKAKSKAGKGKKGRRR